MTTDDIRLGAETLAHHLDILERLDAAVQADHSEILERVNAIIHSYESCIAHEHDNADRSCTVCKMWLLVDLMREHSESGAL